jgi:hypothetical protein
LEKAALFREDSIDETALVLGEKAIHLIEFVLVLIHLYLKELFPELEEATLERERMSIRELLRTLPSLRGADFAVLLTSFDSHDEDDFALQLVTTAGVLVPSTVDHEAIVHLIQARQYAKALRYMSTLFLLKTIDSPEIRERTCEDEAFLIERAFDQFERCGNFEPLFPLLLDLMTRYSNGTRA